MSVLKCVRAFAFCTVTMMWTASAGAVVFDTQVYGNVGDGRVTVLGPNAELQLQKSETGGSSRMSASLPSGELRARASSVSPSYNSGAQAGLISEIEINGPSDQPFLLSITMTVTGDWAASDLVTVLAQSDFISPFSGFVGSSIFRFTSLPGPGYPIFECVNCEHPPGQLFPFSITSSHEFAAGTTLIDYRASLDLVAREAFVDAFNTATFSISLTDGFTYESALTFQNDIPEPSLLSLLGLGLAGIALLRRRRTS